MKDAWIELTRKGVEPAENDPSVPQCEDTTPAPNLDCETLDKVWYRGSPSLTLQATNFKYAGDMYLQEDGNVLSDHNPVLVEFAWSTAA